jgi:hypothetical protein
MAADALKYGNYTEYAQQYEEAQVISMNGNNTDRQ